MCKMIKYVEYSINDYQHHERQNEPHHDVCHLTSRYILLWQEAGLRCNHSIFSQFLHRQTIMAPLAYHRALLKKNQTWVAAYDSLERRFIGITEGILRPSDVSPVSHRLSRTRRQTIETIAFLLREIEYLVEMTEVCVIGCLKMRCYKQESVAWCREYAVGDILPITHTLYRKVVYGWLIPWLYQLSF